MSSLSKGISAVLLLTILFTLLPVSAFSAFLSGDVDSDGRITAGDARIILRLSVGLDKIDEEIRKKADIDENGTIDAEDARLALRLSTGLGLTASSRSIVDGKIIGYTEKNYPVIEKDGLIFIDGVLIANKTYSLSDTYDPGGLLPECTVAFSLMQRDAAAQGLNIYISSGYRSYASQKSIYNRYVCRDGRALADTYSARPGHSEHQTGLAVDLNTITQSFGRTAEGRWVAAHCHEYGFILRYPQGKSHITGYCFEPWHLRYVGIETATKITNSGLCLEEYYGITSEY